MRIDKLYIEQRAQAYPATAHIQSLLEARETEVIDDYQNIFSRKKTPYLNKREKRNIIIAVRQGATVREAPPAYGYASKDPHYYYVHAFNCVYECEYCYLQGYFSSPDLVLFVNHDDILAAMQQTMARHPGQIVWFHAGEFSDSLALSHISGELPLYWRFFEDNKNARLELRTKSSNLSVLRRLQPLSNVTVSFSLSTARQSPQYDREAPSFAVRLNAMQNLAQAGFRLGVHFDPIIWAESFEQDFDGCIAELSAHVAWPSIDYVSLGAVRFAKDVFREARQNYPTSAMFARNFIQGADHKIRYVRPLRLWLLETARQILKKHGCPEEKIYFCME